MDQTQRIREVNDQFRSTLTGGQILLTQGIATLPAELRGDLIRQVRTFSAFTEDNDPYGEHDFGAFTVGGKKIFWKIDYYGLDMLHGSADPSDAAVTKRVLTIRGRFRLGAK